MRQHTGTSLHRLSESLKKLRPKEIERFGDFVEGKTAVPHKGVQAAVDELFDVLGTSRTFVRLGVAPSAQDDSDKETK